MGGLDRACAPPEHEKEQWAIATASLHLPASIAAWLATIEQNLKRGGYSTLRHFDTVIKLSHRCKQNRPCSSCLPDAEFEAAVEALGEKGLENSLWSAPKKKPGRALLRCPARLCFSVDQKFSASQNSLQAPPPPQRREAPRQPGAATPPDLSLEMVLLQGGRSMLRENQDGTKTPLTIPNHKTLKSSTLRTICRQSAIARDDFLKAFDES